MVHGSFLARWIASHHLFYQSDPAEAIPNRRAAFKSSGIDIDGLIARAQQDDVKQKLIKNTNDAVARGAFGSPTFFVGSEMFFGKDQLRDVEESIVQQLSSREAKRA